MNGVQVDVLGHGNGSPRANDSLSELDVSLDMLKMTGSALVPPDLPRQRTGSITSVATSPSLVGAQGTLVASPEAGLRKRAMSDIALGRSTQANMGRMGATVVSSNDSATLKKKPDILDRKGTLGKMWKKVVRTVTVRR